MSRNVNAGCRLSALTSPFSLCGRPVSEVDLARYPRKLEIENWMMCGGLCRKPTASFVQEEEIPRADSRRSHYRRFK